MRNGTVQDAPRARSRAILVFGLALLAYSSACSKSQGSNGDDDQVDDAANTCSAAMPCRDAATPPPSKVPDAGGATDAGKPMPLPTGHPAPSSTACAPTGPSASELGSKREVLFTGARQLAQVSAKHDHPLVADATQGILRYVGGAAMFERVVAATVRSFLEADLSVYWAVGGVLFKASLSSTDGAPDTVAGVPQLLAFLSYDQSNVYFADPNGQQLTQQPLNGDARRTLATSVQAPDMKLLGGYLYYSESKTQQVYRIKLDEDELVAEPLTDGMNTLVQAIAVGDDVLYFVDDTQIFSTPVDDSTQRTPIGQAGPGTLGRGRITSMKLLDDRLFWLDDVGSIGWTAIDGSACGLLLRGEGALPDGWDVDADALYMTVHGANATTALWRIAR